MGDFIRPRYIILDGCLAVTGPRRPVCFKPIVTYNVTIYSKTEEDAQICSFYLRFQVFFVTDPLMET